MPDSTWRWVKPVACLFSLYWLIGGAPVRAERCAIPDNIRLRSHTVKYLNDGDTLTLRNGERVRFIGIDTPEIDHKNRARSQKYAIAARDHLASLVKPGGKVLLVPGKQQHDHHQRRLSHIFLPNGLNLAAEQLRRGYAKQIVVLPNDGYWRCYQRLEQQARKAQLKIWQTAQLQPQPASALSKSDMKRYAVIYGKVTDWRPTRRYIWLEIDGKLLAGIEKRHQGHFSNLKRSTWLNQSVELRGKPYFSHGAFRIKIRHPQALTKL